MNKQRWQAVQESEYRRGQKRYQETGSYFGFFSVPEFEVTSQIADGLAKIDGPVLDIGCGLLPMPNYLKKCPMAYGIDPYLGEKRRFHFAQAIGEQLPFRDGFFTACLLMSSLDHAMSPKAVIDEAWRVLQDDGFLFVWFTPRAKPDHIHEWALCEADILGMAARFSSYFGFVSYPGNRKIGYPKTNMMVLRK